MVSIAICLVRLPVSVGQDMIQRLSSVFNANFTDVTEERITPILIRSTERAVDDTMGLTGVIASFALEILSESQRPRPASPARTDCCPSRSSRTPRRPTS